MTEENFTYRGIKFLWNESRKRYEGISQYLAFYIERKFEIMWVCYVHQGNLFTQSEVGCSETEISKTVAIDIALKNAARHFEIELEVTQLRYNDAVNCLKRD